jgi:hypothetical protein
LIGPGPGRQDDRDVEELVEAPTVEEAAAWRSRPRRAVGGPVAGRQGPGGWAWCRGLVVRRGARGSVARRGRRPGGASRKHRGQVARTSGGARGRRLGGGARRQKPGGGASGKHRGPGGVSGRRRGAAETPGGWAASVCGRLGASLIFE